MKLAEYMCLKCFHRFFGLPGPTVCVRCGHEYVKWENYEDGWGKKKSNS